MGDIVGVYGPHAEHAKKLILAILPETGGNSQRASPLRVARLADYIATLDSRPIEEAEFRRLIQEDLAIKRAWEDIIFYSLKSPR